MDKEETYQTEALRVIEARIAQLRGLTFMEAAALPEASSEEDIILEGIGCSLTVFTQHDPHILPNSILVTVQISNRFVSWGGPGLKATRRRFIFQQQGGVDCRLHRRRGVFGEATNLGSDLSPTTLS